MNTYRIPIWHTAGSSFDFEVQAWSAAEAQRIAEDWHPGSRIGTPVLVAEGAVAEGSRRV